jgi:ribosome-binding factor A
MDEGRRSRIARKIQQELSTMLLRGEIKDHRVSTMLSFTYVKLAKDATVARVGVSSILDDKLAPGVVGLNSAASYLQSRVGKLIKLQRTPRLYFVEDHSIVDGQAVIQTLTELSQDERRSPPSQQADGD